MLNHPFTAKIHLVLDLHKMKKLINKAVFHACTFCRLFHVVLYQIESSLMTGVGCSANFQIRTKPFLRANLEIRTTIIKNTTNG